MGTGLLLLWVLALILALTGLGGLPLLDWDEGIVARVALELSQLPWQERLWPTYWGEVYLNKPPLIHWLIAGCIDLWRLLQAVVGTPVAATDLPPEWLLRLAPAVLSSLIVPWLGLIQWRLRPGERTTALASAAIALLLLKAPTAIPVLVTAMALRALERDLRPRQWLLLLAGLLVGLLPGLSWHLGHALVRGAGDAGGWLALAALLAFRNSPGLAGAA